jgi:hypothetical protein
VRYYFAERDPVGIGGPTNFNPFTNTADSAANLKSAPIGVAKAAPQQFTSVPAGTAAANNVKPVVVTNDGDGPLVFTTAQPSITAHNLDVGSAGRLRGRQPELLGHDAPARRHLHDQRRLQADAHQLDVDRVPAFSSNSDNSTERVLVAGTSTGESLNNVGADVPSLLSLNISPSASFGSLVPGVGRTYDTAMAASVTSTAANATLSVYDASATNVGVMTNGTQAPGSRVSGTPVCLFRATARCGCSRAPGRSGARRRRS